MSDDSRLTTYDSPRRGYWLIGLALGVLLALFLAPATRWLVRQQMETSSLLPSASAWLSTLGVKDESTPGAVASANRAARAYAARHPNDFPIQMACAIRYGTDTAASGEEGKPPSFLEHLRPLESRFPDSPSLYANLLRFDTQGTIMLHRVESDLLNGDPVRTHYGSNPKPEQLAEYDRWAAEGERLEPDNAYFPFMRAVGLYAARRDDEALAAIRRAAGRSQWEEHYQDETEGMWRLVEGAYGDRSAISRLAVAAAVLFPHYAALRTAARVATYRAVLAEKEGHAEEGLEIRRDLMRLGGLMRARSRSLIGSLVGMAITDVAAIRPGGSPPVRHPSHTGNYESDRKASRQARLNEYTAYLRRIGHEEEARRAEDEFRRGEQARDSVRNNPYVELTPIFNVVGWWAADLSLLTNIFWMLLLGGIAALLARSRRIRKGLPLSTPTRWGIALGIAGSVLLACMLSGNILAFVELRFLTGLALLACALVAAGYRSRAAFHLLAVGLLTVLCLYLLAGLYVWQARGVTSMAMVYQNLTDGLGGGPTRYPFILLCFVPLVSLLAALVTGIVSLVCRVPLSVGLARGLRGVAVPVCCFLFLVYGGLALVTAHKEAQASYVLARTMEHEGRYYAELAGRTWPGLKR
jgi:hypothetical protein